MKFGVTRVQKQGFLRVMPDKSNLRGIIIRYHVLFIVIIYICTIQEVKAQTRPAFLDYLNDEWVDSLMNSLNMRQKMGQLFMIQAYSRSADTPGALLEQIEKYHVGGVIFMQGTAVNQAVITNNLQAHSPVPLLIAIDGEWGPGFRLTDSPRYPVQMALGAIYNDSLLFRMGYETGLQLKRIGVHVNFAPVADVNNNPRNPVINYRSFGEDPRKVAHKALMYSRGLQEAGVLAVAKHFPGHGDTSTDSHHTLPIVSKSRDRLNSTELYPFSQLINQGTGGIMTAHLRVPALESDPALPASLSPRIIRELLVGELGFHGLVITDAMNMQGVSGKYEPGEAAVRALQAGNDMLEIVPDLSKAINDVRKALNDGRLTEAEIDSKCRKILALKRWVLSEESNAPYNKGKAQQTDGTAVMTGTGNKAVMNAQVNITGIKKFMDNPSFNLTIRMLHEQSLTLTHNKNRLLPLENLDTLKVAVVTLGAGRQDEFRLMAANYMNIDHFQLNKNADMRETERLVKLLAPYNLLLCGIHSLTQSPASQYGVDPSIGHFFEKTAAWKKVIVLFGNPYALNFINESANADALLVTYQNNEITRELAAQAIFGAINVTGRLPVNVNDSFMLNQGTDIRKNDRLKYTIPEEAGISSTWLEHRIDSLAESGIREKAYPGCQVLIAVGGKVILHKCYGFQTYDNTQPVKETNMYDLASITKITGPLPALIKLHGEGKFKLDGPLANYWPDFKGTDKALITPRQALAHHARFKSGIQFWSKAMLSNGSLDTLVFSPRLTRTHMIRVSSKLYMNKEYLKAMYKAIKEDKLLSRAQYNYSDIPFFLFPRIIENLASEQYENYLKKNFYMPLGASSITYNPLYRFSVREIVPTENDTYFRKEFLRGFVHDEGAAMLGGVSGNAGLFGCANDLAKIMQMYLQKGWYGGKQFFSPDSFMEFVKVQYPQSGNRRALGFDKPAKNNNTLRQGKPYPTAGASPASFGHNGFTGTFTWADPDGEILFIFLTNRVCPTRNNSKLSTLDIRPQMLQTVYDGLKKGNNN